MNSVFDQTVVAGLVARIEALTQSSRPLWGKMNVAQMLAHCNVTYELAYDTTHPKPNALVRFLATRFIKSMVVSERPYRHNLRTAPVFLMTDEKSFAAEQARLIGYLRKTLELGHRHFDGKESHSFGALTATEWSNMFYKHLDHHLRQFGV